MWHRTFHRFATAAAFAQACVDAGWTRDPVTAAFDHPETVALDVIGIMQDPPTVDAEGNITGPGAVRTGFHVNAAWADGVVPASFGAAEIFPASPSRVFA